MNAIDLFAGAGGLGLGLRLAGFSPEGAFEWNNNAAATLRMNSQLLGFHDAGHVVEADVREFDFRRFEGHLDLLAGGPPCQPFSVGGLHAGAADERNMFAETIRAIREAHPKAVLLENVRGLTRRRFVDYMDYVAANLRNPDLAPRPDEPWLDHHARILKQETRRTTELTKYIVVQTLVDAVDYGVPQRRKRIVFVAFRDDLSIDWRSPKPSHSQNALLWDQWISGEYWARHDLPVPAIPGPLQSKVTALRAENRRPAGLPWRTVRDTISDLPEPGSEAAGFAERLQHVLRPGARSYKGHMGSDLDLPAKTLKAGVHGVPGGENTVRLATEAVRYLSVREAARLQTFPDAYRFSGPWTEGMRQIGNAVPVTLGFVFAKAVQDAFLRVSPQPDIGNLLVAV
jgi:site-specific DNA-cytosine methylase